MAAYLFWPKMVVFIPKDKFSGKLIQARITKEQLFIHIHSLTLTHTHTHIHTRSHRGMIKIIRG